MNHVFRTGWCFVLVLAASSSAQGPIDGLQDPLPARVWVVDDDGPADFAQLQPAIDAAASGDLIRVRTDLPEANFGFNGPLQEAVVDGKGLTILGEGPTRPRIAHRLTIQNLRADQSVTVRSASLGSFVINGIFFLELSPPTLELTRNEGPIWIEDCEIEFTEGLGALTAIYNAQSQALLVSETDHLALIRSQVKVTSTSFPWPRQTPDRPGLELSDSSAHVFESSLEGMFGMTSSKAGSGAIVRRSFLFASASRFVGGNGVSQAGDGILVGENADVRALASSFVAGKGVGFFPGNPGQPSVGTIHQLSGETRSYVLDPPLTEDGTVTLTATGPVGELVVSIFGAEPGGAFQPLHLGSRLVAPPLSFVTEGTLPASGVLTQRVSLPPVAPGQSFASVYGQGLFLDANGKASLASASAVVVLP